MQSLAEAREVGVRYAPPAHGGHVESYTLRAADPGGGRALWMEASLFASQRPPYRALASATAVYFEAHAAPVAVKTSVPFEQARFATDALDVEIGHAGLPPALVLQRDACRVDVASGERHLAWDLRLARRGPSLPLSGPGLGARAGIGALRSAGDVLLPAPDLLVDGALDVNGRPLSVEGWRGFLSHAWGEHHPRVFAFGHCNQWHGLEGAPVAGDHAHRSPGGGHDAGLTGELVLHGITVRRRGVAPFARTVTRLGVRYRGVDHVVSGPVRLLQAHAEISPRRWKFRGESELARIEGELWAETDDFAGLFAHNPDGSMGHALVSPLAKARVSIALRHGPSFIARSSAATLVLGTGEPHHGVRMYV